MHWSGLNAFRLACLFQRPYNRVVCRTCQPRPWSCMPFEGSSFHVQLTEVNVCQPISEHKRGRLYDIKTLFVSCTIQGIFSPRSWLEAQYFHGTLNLPPSIYSMCDKHKGFMDNKLVAVDVQYTQ